MEEFKGKVAVACFASNVARMDSVIRAAEAAGRRVALAGRSMFRITAAALRTVDHRGGLDQYLLKADEAELSTRAAKVRRDLKKKLAETAAA